MATQQRVKRIRGTALQNSAVALDDGCLVVKEPVDGTVWVHDGFTLGGFPVGGVTHFPISVPQGGTGDTTLTAHAVLLGEGTSSIGFATIGTAGRVLTDMGPGLDPAFLAPAAGLAVTMHRVSSGTSDTLSTLPSPETMILWTSATGGNKTQSIPAANSLVDGAKLYIKMGPTVAGTLTTTPLTGTINSGANIASNAGDDLMLVADLTNNDWVLV
jgi:hypothetical protein